jgi:predicted CopG family antitoxin
MRGLCKDSELRKQLIILNTTLETKGSVVNLTKIISNCDFLLLCWKNVKLRNSTLKLEKTNLDTDFKIWFSNVSEELSKGCFKFNKSLIVRKPTHGKECKILLFQEDIIEEGIKILLNRIFERSISNSKTRISTHNNLIGVLNILKSDLNFAKWVIEGSLHINLNRLTFILCKSIKDPFFRGLLQSYLKLECFNSISPFKVIENELFKENSLFYLFLNIYLSEFDVWIENNLLPRYNFEEVILSELDLLKTELFLYDKNYEKINKVSYRRSFSNIIITISGTKEMGIEVLNRVKERLVEMKEEAVSLNLEMKNIFLKEIVFLGHTFSKDKTIVEKTTIDLLAPIDIILKILKRKGFLVKDNIPTRNCKYLNLELWTIIETYKYIEKLILNYYSLASNYNLLTKKYIIF